MVRKLGAPIWHEAPEIFFWLCPSTFLALKVQLVVLVSTLMMVSTVWSVSCSLFYSWCPLCPAICKSGGGEGTCPRALWSRRHCQGDNKRRIKVSEMIMKPFDAMKQQPCYLCVQPLSKCCHACQSYVPRRHRTHCFLPTVLVSSADIWLQNLRMYKQSANDVVVVQFIVH